MPITGPDLRAARERLKESQAAFAERFGVDQATVSRWEAGGPPSRGAAGKMIERVLDEVAEARQ